MSQSVNIVSAEDYMKVVVVVDDTMATETSDLTTTASAPRMLTVQRGLIVPPEVLRTELPEVASAVNDAIRSSTRIRRVPYRLQPEITQHTTQQRKRQHTPTYNKRALIATQKKLMQTTPQRKKKITLRQYPRKFHCHSCNLPFPSKEDLNTHNELKHQHKCDDCKIGYSTKEQLQEHMCMFCKLCNKSYTYYGTYVTHFRKYHYKPTFTCVACDEHFNNEDTLTVYRKSYVAFYAHCPKCDCRFSSFLCYECGEAYPDMDGLSKHSHGQDLKHKCSICNAQFEHDFVLASHMQTHSSSVKTYSKVPEINEKNQENVENKEIKESHDTKVEENVNEKWFDNVKETFYKAVDKNESVKDLENDWIADAVKQESEDIKTSDKEVKIEDDELSLNTAHRRTNMLGKSTFDNRKQDGVKKESENWYEFNIEPTEIQFLSEVQIQKHQRTIIIVEDSENRNEKINKSLDIVKVEPSDCNKETGLVEEASSTTPCLVKMEPLELPDEVVSSEPCLARVKTECT
ncbi:uncharacterized protein LOC133532527 [Cydia pomonella]|uniref:uncharacterized protein LOC133532527 n=1 Tax=Cydia pomonella TaxID=82600 RepID=UPI002ADD8A13|nr:uncharacterized protein LOC133532527 [Cydia pomonella]